MFAREEHSSDKWLRRNPRQMARPAHHAHGQLRQPKRASGLATTKSQEAAIARPVPSAAHA
jgi:hypothetical protein